MTQPKCNSPFLWRTVPSGCGKLKSASQLPMRRSNVCASSPSDGLGFADPKTRIIAARKGSLVEFAELRDSVAATTQTIGTTITTMPISNLILGSIRNMAQDLLDQFAR